MGNQILLFVRGVHIHLVNHPKGVTQILPNTNYKKVEQATTMGDTVSHFCMHFVSLLYESVPQIATSIPIYETSQKTLLEVDASPSPPPLKIGRI